jgi:type IV pilus assembly protein PilB
MKVLEVKNALTGEEISIVDALDSLISHAHSSRASDIHIDPTDENVRVRLRIDGVLHEAFAIPKSMHQEIISRIKVLAGLRTDEHQAAQDGRIRVNLESTGPIDIRVSIAPTYHGENAVLRLLVDRNKEFSLENLGFSKDDQDKIMKAIKKPHGMILSTGPTGSGKTTTLYTILKSLNRDDVSIITIEDPVEYAVSGLKQIQVNPQAGLTFASGLRSVLRQDPNIIMVGEIRDKETAGIAVNTALTGHLLLSTLHTNDSATTLPRLLDMGIEPYLVASTVNLAIGQRLVRKLCNHCKREKQLSGPEIASVREFLVEAGMSPDSLYYEAVGCKECGKTGYSGRVCVNEVMVVDEDLREAILEKESSDVIRRLAKEKGMRPMIADGMTKVKNGITSLDEVMRVIHE